MYKKQRGVFQYILHPHFKPTHSWLLCTPSLSSYLPSFSSIIILDTQRTNGGFLQYIVHPHCEPTQAGFYTLFPLLYLPLIFPPPHSLLFSDTVEVNRDLLQYTTILHPHFKPTHSWLLHNAFLWSIFLLSSLLLTPHSSTCTVN